MGFKESSVTFQDVFYNTVTSGNSPTSTTGGKGNAMQIGLGVQVGAISKNMASGTWTATGKTTDMMLQGNGFFTVKTTAECF